MDTRLGSIYLMVDRLIDVKSSIQELTGFGNKNLFLTTAQWEQAEELRDILQKAFEVTKKLQIHNPAQAHEQNGQQKPSYYFSSKILKG
jgi:hypothetical protein